ncbi:hypothetical protein ABIB62_003021 [Mucilaginibacter sp. UYP25]|uniref:hypothetical protein n=1 Tax=unclassified Mucilaginibacter TaxID=2617802 RepID=UPI003396129F
MKNIKLYIFLVLFSLIGLYSCKKDNTTIDASRLIIGTWHPASTKATFYDAITGAEKSNPGFDVDTAPSVTFGADGQYYAGDEKGTYKYNASTQVLILTNDSGVQNAKVTELNDNSLTVENSLTSGDTRILLIQSYIK